MKRPETLYPNSDFPDTKHVFDGYDMTEIPEATTENFNKLIDHYNELVHVVNELADKAGIKFEDEK